MTGSVLQNLALSRRTAPAGITSVCSAHPLVLSAALRLAKRRNQEVLIEATCNQVNQFGGYTGQTPQAFAAFVAGLAAEQGLPMERVILGGDHLGPNPWRKEPAEVAMAKAEAMVAAYVEAGFGKIHLDASMGCAGEPPALDDEATAERAVRLARVAEASAEKAGLAPPCYVIGTEVPIPGGADHALDHIRPTTPAAARRTLEIHRATFERHGLQAALDRVLALVVQPGVEFGNDNVIAYDPDLTTDLTGLLGDYPTLVYEAHSTDYQTGAALAALVRNGFPILKVGPGLTFAMREAIYALDLIASELVDGYGARPLAATMEAVMLAAPGYWQGYYTGSERAQYVQRHYSFSDRSRYYWGTNEVRQAWERLRSTLAGVTIPPTLWSQYLPQIPAEQLVGADPDEVVMAAVDLILLRYDEACRPAAA